MGQDTDLSPLVVELVVSIDRMLSGMGKGRMPSPRLQSAMNAARRAVVGIPEQLSPIDEDAE
jgi:hypothetical protein